MGFLIFRQHFNGYAFISLLQFPLLHGQYQTDAEVEGVDNEIVKLAGSITDEQKEEGDLTHLIGILTTENQVSDLLVKVPLAAYTWAIFTNRQHTQ